MKVLRTNVSPLRSDEDRNLLTCSTSPSWTGRAVFFFVPLVQITGCFNHTDWPEGRDSPKTHNIKTHSRWRKSSSLRRDSFPLETFSTHERRRGNTFFAVKILICHSLGGRAGHVFMRTYFQNSVPLTASILANLYYTVVTLYKTELLFRVLQDSVWDLDPFLGWII